MSQVSVIGRKSHLQSHRTAISDAIHGSLVTAIGLPQEKRFHRFLALEPEDFIFPADRSEKYTIVEISMFEGRSRESKKELIRLLFNRLQQDCQIQPQDVEITIFETPKSNWGIRGLSADELELNYKVEV